MESGSQRRLDSLSRHFLQPHQANRSLFPNLLRGVHVKDVEADPVLIGGMVLDIQATPSISAKPKTTTPGKVHYVPGGVARNIAECMSKLGTKPYMISALGLDMAGNMLLEHWKSARLSIEGIRKHHDIQTSVVCHIFDGDGELAAGVASVEAIENFLTSDWIRQFKCNICSAPVLMVDANLSPSALEASCQMAAESSTPVWFEPVSVIKSRRVASVAKYITFASPNEDELIAMANALSCKDVFHPIQRDYVGTKCSIESLFQMLKPAILVLLEKGIKVVVLTLGSDGVFLCSKEGPGFMNNVLKGTKPQGFGSQLYEIITESCPSNLLLNIATSSSKTYPFAVHLPALPASVARLTGAGDCLVGGTLASMCAGLDVLQSVAAGIAAAKAAVEGETNVPSEYSLAKIADDARRVCSSAKVISHRSML